MNNTRSPGGTAVEDDFTGTDTADPLGWYDPQSKAYWFENESEGEWVRLSEKQATRRLMIDNGLENTRQAGQAVSAIDAELYKMENFHRLAFVGAVAGWKTGIHQFGGQPALVPYSPELIEPKPGEWETLRKVFAGLFIGEEDGETVDQTPFFYAWLKHALEALYVGLPARGLAQVLAGDPGCGKSLLLDIYAEMMGRKRAFPYRYMTGSENFNSEWFESVLLVVDDENANTKIEARRAFAAQIKQVVATPEARCRGLHKNPVTLKPHWRLCICVNLEPERLMVLPPLDADVQDKLLVFKAYKKPLPMPVDTEESKRAFFEQLRSEMPALIHWLFNDHDPGDAGKGRFGCQPFQHPQILDALYQTSPAFALDKIIARLILTEPDGEFDPGVNFWRGKAEGLFNKLTDHNDLTYTERNKMPKDTVWFGRRLGELQRKWPERYRVKHTESGNQWTIARPGWMPKEP